MVLLTLLRRTDNSCRVNIPQVCLTVYVFQVVKELVASATSKDFPKENPFSLLQTTMQDPSNGLNFRHRAVSATLSIKWWSQGGSNSRPPACKAGALPAELWPHRMMVGLGGLEPPTSPLSGVRSNHLSYRPGYQQNDLLNNQFLLKADLALVPNDQAMVVDAQVASCDLLKSSFSI